MTPFIKNLSIFTLLLFGFFSANSIVNYYIFSTQPLPIKNSSILIIGDSHTEKGLDPSLFNNAQNISQPAEPYILTYWKLKKIYTTYKPDTIILGFAPHNISAFNDLKFYKKKHAIEMTKRSYPIASFNDISSKIPFDYLDCYKTIWKEISFYPKKDHINYIGHYSNNSLSNISDYKSVITRHYFYKNKELGISNISIDYLDSIVSLCEQEHSKIIFVSSPVHKNYYKNIPAQILAKYRSLKKTYNGKIQIIDETQTIYPDTLFLNSDHLNSLGAHKFTKEVIKKIKYHKHNNIQ